MGVHVSNQWDDDDLEDNSQQQTPGKGLRQQLEAALKRNKELESKLAETTTQLRKEAVARVIQGKGLKAKVAKLIPNDVEPSEEAITKWLEEWGDVFGVDNLKETPPEDQGQQAPKPGAEPNPDDDLSNAAFADKLRAMGQVTGQATAPVKDEDVLRRLNDPNLDRKGLMELINAAGGGYGTG